MIAETVEDCIIYDGKGWADSNGGTSTIQQVTGVASAEDCMQFNCYNHPQCVAFTYIESIQRCDLKTEAQAVTLNDAPNGVMSAFSPKFCQSGRFHRQIILN